MVPMIAPLVRCLLSTNIRPPWIPIHLCGIGKGLPTIIHCNTFYQTSRKGDERYDKQRDFFSWKNVREGFPLLRKETKKWVEELKDTAHLDPDFNYRIEGQIIKQFDFKGPESLENWVASSDQDNNEGFSEAGLSLTNTGRACFSGVLSNRLPKDGKIKKAGYVSMRSIPLRKAFQRRSSYVWVTYTHFMMRVRGDGRTYMIHLHTPGGYAMTLMDMYSYVLPTRGGPYWQDVKIPFSKFFFNAKGCIDDTQVPIDLTSVNSVSIALADRAEGPFRLELDYIGLLFDGNHIEDFAYEGYIQPAYTIGL